MLMDLQTLIGTQLISMRQGGIVSECVDAVVDPDNLKVIALVIKGGLVTRAKPYLLDLRDIRKIDPYGIVIDDLEDLVWPDEIVHLNEVLSLNFNLIGMKVETKKRTRLGKVISYLVNTDDFMIYQIVVKRPAVKSFMDPELTIHRKEIIEVTDYKLIVKDEMRQLKKGVGQEDFVPNFVNPFRNPESGFAPIDKKSPGDRDIE